MTQTEFQERFGGEIINDWLVFSGDLYCYHNQLTSLPEKLKVGGSLYCSHNQLTSLPEKLNVSGSLDCSHNQLTSVPNYIKNIKYCYIFQNLNWNDPVWINKILKDELTPDEVFAIDNIEHRRIAYQYMDKTKMKQLKDYKVLDENTDMNGNKERIVSFTVQNMKESLKFLNVICPTGREYFLGTDKDKCSEAQKALLGLDSDVEFIKRW